MGTKAKIVLATIIWVTVMVLGWRSVRTVLPQYGYFQSRPQIRTPQDWAKLYQEEEVKAKKFLESTDTPTWVRAEPAPPGDRFDYQGWKSDATRELVYVKNTPLRQVVSRLSGVNGRRVLEPEGQQPRWNIEAILPAGRDESVRALLKEIKYQRDIYQLPERVFAFTEGSPPGSALGAPAGGPGRTVKVGDKTLGALSREVQGWTQMSVRVDRRVRNRKPANTDQAMVILGGTPDHTARQVAQIYGVSLSTESRDTTHVLIYPSGSKSGKDMDEWVRTITAKTTVK